MEFVRRFILDELKTYSSSTVDEQVREYNRLPPPLRQLVFDQVMEFKVCSRNMIHVAEAIEELHPVIAREDISERRRTKLMALIAVAHYRLRRFDLCANMLTVLVELRHHASLDTRSLMDYLATHLVTSPAAFVKSVAKTVVLVAGVYLVTKHGGTVAKVLKIAVKNMEMVSDGGKVGVAIKFPVREQV